MNYANRDIEYGTLRQLIENGSNPIFIYAYHASGVTSFVKMRMKAVCTSLFDTNIIYIDASKGRPLSELLLTQLVRSDYLEQLQQFADKKWGAHAQSLLSAALEGIPYAGPILSRLSEHSAAVPLYSGVYPSAMEEVLTHFFEKQAAPFLIVIDTVELLGEDSYEMLLSLLRAKNIRCILIRTENTLHYDKLENFLFQEGVSISSRLDFDRPQVKLVKELGSLYDISLSTEEATKIISQTQQNIHSIIKEIRCIKLQSQEPSLTQWEKAIISILDGWGSPLAEETLYQILSKSEVFSFSRSGTFRDTLYALQARDLIETDSLGLTIKGRYDPQVQNVLNSISDQLYYRNAIYEFLTESTCPIRNDVLRYRLSKELNCTTPNDAKAYLRQTIIAGKDVTSDVIAEAKLKKGDVDDCLLAGIKYCRERRYEESYEWISSIPAQSRTPDIDALGASLLNRVRRSEEAEIALKKCLERDMNPSHQNLLSAFLISTYVHMERLKDAQKIYEEKVDMFPSNPMHGYLVRNAISAFIGYREDLYKLALQDFLRDHDDFGYYTTMCNQGYALCRSGNYRDALSLLEKALNGLECFPRSNLHIVYNDLGICNFYLGKHQIAYHYFLLALRFSRNTMPEIFSTINLSCLEAVMGETEQAIQRIESIHQKVRRHKLDRVRQKYYINYLLIKYLSGSKDIEELIPKAALYPDRYSSAFTKEVTQFYQGYLSAPQKHIHRDWQALYSPCGLAYWYMDPLKFLSESLI